jgi:hypothetical protein
MEAALSDRPQLPRPQKSCEFEARRRRLKNDRWPAAIPAGHFCFNGRLVFTRPPVSAIVVSRVFASFPDPSVHF